ncbi:odorant receptor 94a-like [Hylaeus anthracinus]|uniref:odorant receptor 94a-like n=1 Tax=Hylaeus anthracinus TaxID=313031 RepID=UPI0023B978D3|nr:odorant receptor 94a-like [Hylaeus anthracinus]
MKYSLIKIMEMSIIFKILAICGVWRPITWSSRFKTVVYSIYTIFVLCVSVNFTLTQLIAALIADNVDDFIETTYILVTAMVACGKMGNILVYRKKFIEIIKIFHEEPCATSDTEEMKTQMKCDKQIRNNTIQYLIMIETSVMTTLLNSIMVDIGNNRLMYRAWIPYNYSSTVLYPLTYSHQAIGLFYLSLPHVAADVLFFGLLMQTCCQFEILESRLNRIKTNEKMALRNCLRHHNNIYELATMTNNAMNVTIFSQFFGSFLVLCLSLVQLLKQDIMSADFLATILYLSTILIQSFLYCWYGNEVKLKSIYMAQVIFQTDWTEMNERTKKILIVAMARTTSPIVYESAHIVTVNLDFFVILIKSSYSLYNVLQTTRK